LQRGLSATAEFLVICPTLYAITV